MADGQKIKVLYLAGHPRNGSTLLSQLLGQVNGYFAAGEIHLVWERGFSENQLCGCGKPVRQCEFWGAVVERAFGGWDGKEFHDIWKLWRSVGRIRQALWVTRPNLRTSDYNNRITTFTAILEKLYSAIQAVSQCRVIVDSSKIPIYTAILNQVAILDLKVTEMIRDCRAVAFSFQRKRVKPTVGPPIEYLHRTSPLRVAKDWTVTHLATEFIRKSFPKGKYISIRYESMADKPVDTLRRILEDMEEGAIDLSFFADEHTANLGINHIVAGNRYRFKRGAVPIQLDAEWHTRMLWRQKALVTAVTWPLLLRYGYPLFIPLRY